ncbi:MAG: type II toxin-antitoxin system VapC family toxin [Gammaproteobacteria bacterium]
MVILDTCAIIEINKTKPQLSNKTLNKIDEGAYILSISFAEIACKIKAGKLEMNLTADDLYYKLMQIPTIDIIKIGVEEWLESIDLDWDENRDPADRLIVTFAKRKKIPIITSDKKIKSFYKQVIWR